MMVPSQFRRFHLERTLPSLLLGVVFALGTFLPAHAQDGVPVHIPDTTVGEGETVTVPVTASNLDQAEDILSFGFELQYESSVLSFTGVETDGTISDDAGFTVASNPDNGKVGGYGASPLNAEADSGAIVRLTFDVDRPEASTVSLEAFDFNDGTPAVDPDVPSFAINGSSLQLNEVLWDPPSGDAGDANGDGTRDASEDEFVEFYNTSTDVGLDLDGYEIWVDGTLRHEFSSGTRLGPEGPLVVFGGGEPADSIPGVVTTASSGSLELADDGGTVRVQDAEGDEVVSFSYDGSIAGESATRDPDITGDFVAHTTANANRPFSPGRTTGGEPLPVEFAVVRARSVDGGVRVQWRTASETNNAGFRVQHRREDPTGEESGRWTEIGYVESKAPGGTTTEPTSYQFTTDPLPPGRYQFRLEQVDLDGTPHPSRVVTAKVAMEEPLRLTPPTPHPVHESATVRISVKTKTEATVTLYDALGRPVKRLYQGTPPAGTAQDLQIDASDLASGMYLLRLEASGRTETQRLTVAR